MVCEISKELKRENEIVKMVYEERAAKAGSYFLSCDKDSLLIAKKAIKRTKKLMNCFEDKLVCEESCVKDNKCRYFLKERI